MNRIGRFMQRKSGRGIRIVRMLSIDRRASLVAKRKGKL